MRKLHDRLIAAVQIFSGALSLLMLAVIVLGVFYRYVVDDALVWYDEFAGYILVWLTMYGSVVALARRKHIGFETLVEQLPPRIRHAAELFGHLCVLAFSLVLVVYGWQLIREMHGETAVSLPWVQMSWVYSVMPVSGALMAFVSAAQALEAIRGAERAAAPPAALPDPALDRAHPSMEKAR